MEWYYWLIIGVVAAGVIATIITMLATGKGKQLKAWLLIAVEEAEKALGGGTGPLKLQKVYDGFIAKFPKLSKFISYATFCKLVDKALEKLGYLLKDKEEIKTEE